MEIDKIWQNKIEEDIQNLAQSISQLSISLEKYIEYAKELQERRFLHIEQKLSDHEHQIRQHTKFMYQALGITSIIILGIQAGFKFFTKGG